MELIRDELGRCADKDKARVSASFFKTGRGEYGEGAIFLGVSMPDCRRIAKSAIERLSLDDVLVLLESNIHTERLVGVLILVEKYDRGDEEEKGRMFDFYLKNAKRVNNWDLVDLSAWKIVGRWLVDKEDRSVLDRLALSENLWEMPIAIVSCFAFIRKGELEDALRISKVLLGDSEDLIHKAVGWMLREVGKKDVEVLSEFLMENYDELPRTSLRYAIEKFGEEERKEWLGGVL